MNLSLEKSDQLLKIVREMWFEYLRGRLICFAGKSNPINSAARDKPMYAGKISLKNLVGVNRILNFVFVFLDEARKQKWLEILLKT
jgi:hypothetical protein